MAITEERIERLSQADGHEVLTEEEAKELAATHFWYTYDRGSERAELSRKLFARGELTPQQAFEKADKYLSDVDDARRRCLD